MTIRVEVSGGTELLADLRGAQALVHAEAARAVMRTQAMGQTIVRAAASTGNHPPGRNHIEGTGPGPNVATGAYRRGIKVTNQRVSVGEVSSELSTNAVQAMRLEYGFVGRDSIGRYYQQPAYPHWGPSEAKIQEYGDTFADEAAQRISKILGGGGAG